jgi:hypothetical protein
LGKYEPLAKYLEKREGDSWNATFAQVEEILGFELPRSAYEYAAWWSNQKGPGHSQKEGWQSVGWETRDLDLANRTVRFVKSGAARVYEAQQGYIPPASTSDLWRRVRELTGLDDRAELEAHVLRSFIRQEAGKRLIALGGTMPEAEAPPRRRFE